MEFCSSLIWLSMLVVILDPPLLRLGSFTQYQFMLILVQVSRRKIQYFKLVIWSTTNSEKHTSMSIKCAFGKKERAQFAPSSLHLLFVDTTVLGQDFPPLMCSIFISLSRILKLHVHIVKFYCQASLPRDHDLNIPLNPQGAVNVFLLHSSET